MSSRQGTLFGWPSARPVDKGRRTQLPAPWRRVERGTGTCGSEYVHPAGYYIQHCGHPTANYPYALYGPDRALILAPNGRAFQKSIYAALHVQTLLDRK